MARTPFEVRYGRSFHLSLAIIATVLTIAAALFWLFTPAAESQADQRLWVIALCAAGMIYYAVRSIRMLLDRRPQIVIGPDGVWVGFGRNLLIGWDDIRWARVRGIRPMLQIGISPEILPKLRVSIWNFDDNLTALRGAASAFGIRANGMDASVGRMLEAMETWRRGISARAR